MAEEVISTTQTKSEVKLSAHKNVIPITSISDLGSVVGEIYNQLTTLANKFEGEISPEFKALMEGYINKANEAEELKVKLENTSTTSEQIKAEIFQIRETNRNLNYELQRTRESLKELEQELNIFKSSGKKNELEYKEKIKHLNAQILDYEDKIKFTEEENLKINQEREKQRQELLDQNFKFRQNEQESISERDSLKKQIMEFETLLKELQEQIELRTKEAEYKDALLNQLIKQTTTDKLKPHPQEPKKENNPQNVQNKRRGWFF